ncbi:MULTISPECIES: DUF397 domain-containing protein [Saccharopolyspora]|nr:DUF397 domain-containing protein [Saccharopolyspora sp. 6V]MCA1193181.1 DUF397 domain-containing protein [Saccharopolyspora sp. 6V]
MDYDTGWLKSSRSSGTSNMCVEVRLTARGVLVRDSKDPEGGRLDVGHAAWRRFLAELPSVD